MSNKNWFERQERRTRIDINTLPSWLLCEENRDSRAKKSYSERIEALIQFFSSSFTESAQADTPFDMEVIGTLTKLRDKYR